ncbi:cation transporter [Derxia gummosa]|uniref:Cation transporter n=1 Tax=Derxia gummosa DSM 723 TaxID=1121388 RepID=A0A9U5D3D4_9BURK|nr:cation transporter [Derxia gummosa]
MLRKLLAINAVMFFVEGGLGWIAGSTALLADSLDMAADAMVYGVSLYAVGRTLEHKRRAALLSGVVELALGLGVLMQVAQRALFGAEPESLLMMGVGLLALIANVACLRLLSRHRDGEVHMKASWIFSKNDVIANVGVIAGGLLVMLTGSRWPDLVIGAVIGVIVLRGGLYILRTSMTGPARAA